VTVNNVETFEHFRLQGWMRVRAAFPMNADPWSSVGASRSETADCLNGFHIGAERPGRRWQVHTKFC
jgi:hypothetical protein